VLVDRASWMFNPRSLFFDQLEDFSLPLIGSLEREIVRQPIFRCVSLRLFGSRPPRSKKNDSDGGPPGRTVSKTALPRAELLKAARSDLKEGEEKRLGRRRVSDLSVYLERRRKKTIRRGKSGPHRLGKSIRSNLKGTDNRAQTLMAKLPKPPQSSFWFGKGCHVCGFS